MAERRAEDRELLAALTRALRAGDSRAVNQAFETIYGTYVRSVAFVCARYLQDDADVQSVTNDVFVRFFQRVAYLDDLMSLRAYLTAAARHAALDHLRARSRREDPLVASVHVTDEDGLEADLLSMLPDPCGDVTASLRYAQLTDDLRATLGDEATEIVLSHAVCDESFSDIAARLGKKENTVKTMYHRAIKKFRREKGDRWL